MKEKIKKQKDALAVSIEQIMPRLSLDEKMLPAMKDWKVGEEYEITLKVKQIGAHINTDGKHDANFEILKAMTQDEEDKEDKKEKE